MPKSDNQKLKILYILDYLQKNSHQDHPVRTSELLSMLEEHDIVCDRKTVYSDIAALQDYGVDILSIPGKNGGYYIASRNFELPELKLLIDAVQSSRFLTEKKSRELIEKLCSQCSVHDARLMRRDVLVSGRVKSMNESIYFNVDAVQEAIAQNKQITFRYFDWDLGGKRKYRDKSYQASPYGLCQDNENCYLLAHSLRHGVTSYRLDRMSSIRLTEESRTPCPELMGKALAEHASRLFQMFSGEETAVKLRFDPESDQRSGRPLRQGHSFNSGRGRSFCLYRQCGGVPHVPKLGHRLRRQGENFVSPKRGRCLRPDVPGSGETIPRPA